LNTAFEIAKKISFQQQKKDTRFIVNLSIGATAISVAAIILTFSIVNGFQEVIANKVYSFWGQVRITGLNGTVLQQDDHYIQQLRNLPGVQSVHPYITQTTVLSFKEEIEGVSAKAMPLTSKQPFLVKGRNIGVGINGITSKNETVAQEIIISTDLARKLKATIGSDVRLYFLNNGTVIQRKLKLVGLYHAGIDDYDQQFVMVDIKLIQQLAENTKLIEGYTIDINSSADSKKILNQIQATLPPNSIATTIEDSYPQLFDWINVQNVNRNVTITIMLIIAIVNLLTCLFILMLERINMIGTLTAIGASHELLRKIFLYQALFISSAGIILGSIVGIGLSLLQQLTGWITLDESAYFMKELPIHMNPVQIILIIVFTAIISYLSFLLPTLWIKKISPAKSIRFD